MKTASYVVLVFLMVISLNGCKTAGEASPFNFLRNKEVKVEKAPEYMSKLSDCVIVMPVEAISEKLERYSPELENALFRHVGEKFKKVIRSNEVRKVSQTNNLIPRFSRDQQKLREKFDCHTVVQGRLVGPGASNFLIWSGHEVGIEITFPDSMSMANIWQGRYVTSRSSGGLSMSPIGVAVDVTRAQMMVMDDDIIASVISDGVRKIMEHFPRSS